MASNISTLGCDPLFNQAVNDIVDFRWRQEVEVSEIPSPQRIAPFSVAIEADIVDGDNIIGTGRLILLHDPSVSQAWEGTFRCVTFAKADVDISMVTDPLLAEVGWSWLTESLEINQAEYVNASGTVTAVSSQGFGAMSEDPCRAELEIRASWTPFLSAQDGLKPHLFAWQDLLCTISGVPPLPKGISQLGTKLSRR